MSTVTPNINLTKPSGIENYSLPIFNGNFDKIDASMVLVSRASSTVNNAQWDFRQSSFTKLTVGTMGVIVASFYAVLKSGQNTTLPDNTSAGNEIVGVIPAEYRARVSVGFVNGPVFSGEGRGDSLQMFIPAANGSIFLRSSGASFNRASNGNVILKFNTVFEWDGSV